MSRYRPPRPKSSPYITPEGRRRLQAELKGLWKDTRPEVTRRVAEAAAQGDRSENADYIYGKRQLRDIDRRVGYLSRRLDELVVVDRAPPDRHKVYFGAWVSVAEDGGAAYRYRLVGADELDREPGHISIDSPMARQLLGKRVGDPLEVAGRSYVVTGIDYVLPPDCDGVSPQ